MNNIARWDGSTWHALSDGTNGPVAALTVHDGTLIVGGSFTQAGTTAVNYIASWDGAVWDTLAAGFDGPVEALTIFVGESLVSDI